jgi:hypothetical protein
LVRQIPLTKFSPRHVGVWTGLRSGAGVVRAGLIVAGLWLLSGVPVASAADGDLIPFPASVDFRDSAQRVRMVATVKQDSSPQFPERDATGLATWKIADPSIARVVGTGIVEPLAVGQTTLVVEHGGKSATVPIVVHSLNSDRPVHFATEIEPVLTRYGCNAGGCHGKASGQNGFKLSLFGFDHEFDHQVLVLDARGRRVSKSHPSSSLLLTKSIGKVPHGGGKRFDVDSEAYRLILRWIEQGAAADAENVPTITRLAMHPAARVMSSGWTQQVSVTVELSDGTKMDVTRDCQFDTNNGAVASVTDSGLVTTNDLSGEAAIMARYRGQVAVFRAIVPHGQTTNPKVDELLARFQPANEIDRLVAKKWRTLGLAPSPAADDATFLRRVTVDLAGRLPTEAETREYLGNSSTTRKEELVDRLLASNDHAAFFAMRWGTILRNSNLAGADQTAYAFHNWLKQAVASNKPYDQMVRGIVAASGEWQDAPAINWFWQSRDDLLHQVTADTAQVFLGMRLQCARCHHHPYEKWSQEDYFGLAGFYMRLGQKSFGQPPPFYSATRVMRGDLNPLTGKAPEPKYLGGEYAKFRPEEDPRQGLVDWMARPENPFFAKTFVNRYWGHFFGRGLVDQVDDMRETNPPSNPELLDWLAKDFVDSRFDMRRVVRQMVLSATYGLSSDPIPENAHDQQNYARFYARRLVAEVLLDSVDQVTGSKTQFGNLASTGRAIDLPHENFGNYFLESFDRPRRVSGCECERSSAATLGQVLLLSNSDEIENKLADEKGRVQTLIKANKTDAEIIDTLFLTAFSRFPRKEEQMRALAHVTTVTANPNDPGPRRQALEDVVWSLLNTREFLFNR